MAEIYGEGSTTVPGLLDRRRARPRLAADPRAPRGARGRAGAVPGADRRRRPRGRALGRRGAAGPRPPAAVGRAALPARVARHASAAPARWTRPAPTSRSAWAARAGSTTASPPQRLADGPRRPARQARPRRRARRGGHDRRRRRRTPPTCRSARRCACCSASATCGPLLEGRAGERVARAWFPDYPGDIPAGAFPAGWVPSRC